MDILFRVGIIAAALSGVVLALDILFDFRLKIIDQFNSEVRNKWKES